MRWCLLIAALSFVAAAPPARADACEGVPALGACLDAQTLVWCADGAVKTAVCPEGELCAQHAAFGDGYGCVPLASTACADITAEGECTSANHVVWCNERGEVELEACENGTTCGWDEASGWYDCLPMAPAVPPDDAGADAGAGAGEGDAAPPTGPGDAEAPDAGPEPDAGGGPGDAGLALSDGPRPTPRVSAGGADEAPVVQGAGDCAGGPAGGSWGLALLAAAWVAARRRLRA